MKAIKLDSLGSSPANEGYLKIPEIEGSRPRGKQYFSEFSLQRLDGFENGVDVVRWYGARNGVWHPASDMFLVTK
jgi:hypothetical protein